jgi:DNA-binding response OmpR family regulator
MSTKILIVEDELIAAEFLSIFLQKKGYIIVDICQSGSEAITKAKELKPDVIFMDIYLKDNISGCEAALKIVEKIKTKIIFLTAYSDNEMLEYATDVQAVNYLIKPYNEKQILVALNMALKQKKESSFVIQSEIVELEYGFSYDKKKKKLFKDNYEVKLSGKSLALVAYLCEHNELIVSVPVLSRYLYNKEISPSTLRAIISRIKIKLGYELIENISGLGYKIIKEKQN